MRWRRGIAGIKNVRLRRLALVLYVLLLPVTIPSVLLWVVLLEARAVARYLPSSILAAWKGGR